MRFLFRTDADATIGTGHLMRCLALAEALRAGGAECIFLGRVSGLGALAKYITDAGHVLLSLPQFEDSVPDTDGPPHAGWLHGGQENDSAACLAALGGQPPIDWLVVDHYAIDCRWESKMRQVTSRIMVIDDLADRQHDCDLLLDQSLIDDMDERYNGLVPEYCIRLLGPRYALLRKEFATQEALPKKITTEEPRLLVMFGGADLQNLTLRTIELLVAMDWGGDVDVVAGPLYKHLAQLRRMVSRLAQGHLHVSANNVATLMRKADLALGSPGVASWERCACALPAITIAQADNQEGIGHTLGEAGANFYLGRAELLTDAALSAALSALLANESARKAMSRAAAAVCDGQGVRRVASRLLTSQLEIRGASRDDAAMLFEWRNDERTRQHFRNPSPLVLEKHLLWFENVLKDTSKLFLIVLRKDVPLGCVRFDISSSIAEVSIYIDPSQQGLGIGAGVLQTALDELNKARPEVRSIRAEVLAANRASAATFKRCGFIPQSQYFELKRPVL